MIYIHLNEKMEKRLNTLSRKTNRPYIFHIKKAIDDYLNEKCEIEEVLETKKLKAFCAVAKHGSYKKSANSIFENYGTVRKWLISLEKELQIHLFNIKDKKFILTEAGENFIPYAKSIVESAETGIACFQDSSQEMKGDFTIATTNAIADLWIIDSLKEFILKYPQLKIQIKSFDENLSLEHREADVSIVNREIKQDNILQEPLLDFSVGLYASESYVEKYGLPKNIEDLKNHKIISYGKNIPHPYESINWHLDYLPSNFIPPISINSIPAIHNLIEKGIGIGPIYNIETKYRKNKLFEVLPNECKGPKVTIYLSYLKSRKNSIKIKNSLNFLRRKWAISDKIN